MTPPLLSIILPAHNEERRLPQTLDEVGAFIQAQPYSIEVVLVEAGVGLVRMERRRHRMAELFTSGSRS